MSRNTATKIPAITQIKGLPPLAVMALQAIKETLEVREGLHEPLDRFVSVRELADLILEDEEIVTYLGSGHSHDDRYFTKSQWNLGAKGDLNIAQAADVPGTLAVGTDNQLLRADSGAALGIDYFSLLGTSNQLTVTHNASDTTLSLPQNIHAGASPTFNALTLSNIVAGTADYDKFLVSDGGVLKYRTGAQLLSDIGGGGGAGFSSGCRVYRNAAQSIPTSSWTKIQFNTEDYDSLSEYDNTTNYRFKAKAAGIYVVSGAIHLLSMGNGDRLVVTIYKNGSEYARGMNFLLGAAGDATGSVCSLVKLAIDDYVEIYTYHDHGSALNTGNTGATVYMAVQRIL